MFKTDTPKSHPRYKSLYYRDLLSWGVKVGVTSYQGLTAHGRGEAFDYLIGEKTCKFALQALKAASSMLLMAENPVLSINGNSAILVPKEYVELADILNAKLEINLFHGSKKREEKIKKHLKKHGAKKILLSGIARIPGIESNRSKMNIYGQASADVVFVPLEDGDRTEALKQMEKKVITIDLNPFSRTARFSDITIIDNIVRSMPLLVDYVKKRKNYSKKRLNKEITTYSNKQVLKQAASHIYNRLKSSNQKVNGII